jgi:biotin carboxyl carrier protein
MPGTILAVNVSSGEAVGAGQPLGVMEAMKMELSLTAPFDGSVAEVNVKQGDRVELGARLFLVSAKEDGS